MTPLRLSEQTLEERAAARRLAASRRLQAAAAARRAQAARERLKVILAETRERFPLCRCELNPRMTAEQVRALGGGCTDPHHVCPRLDAVRRRMAGGRW